MWTRKKADKGAAPPVPDHESKETTGPYPIKDIKSTLFYGFNEEGPPS
jgi:hypothetical protein